jgi:short-subunit dehydrogenase
MKIKDKVIIVTGASKGIGLATSRLLANKGAKVVLAARSFNILKKLEKELPGSLAIKTDMTDEKSIIRMVNLTKKHFGRIDILINNAGQGYDAPVEKTNLKIFRRIFDLDVAGPLLAMQEVIPIMRKQGGGMVVNVSSGLALMILPNMASYSGIKKLLAIISLTAGEELKKDKIRFSVVYPYITLTDFEKNTIKYKKDGGPEEGGTPYPPDTAEYIAKKIVEGIEKEKPEVFAHEWMKKLAK